MQTVTLRVYISTLETMKRVSLLHEVNDDNVQLGPMIDDWRSLEVTLPIEYTDPVCPGVWIYRVRALNGRALWLSVEDRQNSDDIDLVTVHDRAYFAV